MLVLHDRKVIAATTGALRKDALVSVLGLDKLPTSTGISDADGLATWAPTSRPGRSGPAPGATRGDLRPPAPTTPRADFARAERRVGCARRHVKMI
jgi:hypothetical protein